MPTMTQEGFGPRAAMLLRTSGVLESLGENVYSPVWAKGHTNSIENSVLSAWMTVLTPPGASRPSSGHVSPKRALFWVVAKTGMLRI